MNAGTRLSASFILPITPLVFSPATIPPESSDDAASTKSNPVEALSDALAIRRTWTRPRGAALTALFALLADFKVMLPADVRTLVLLAARAPPLILDATDAECFAAVLAVDWVAVRPA